MFNLTGTRRASEIATQLRLMAIAERALQYRTRAAINRAVSASIEAYKARGSLDYALRDHAPEIERLLVASYQATIDRFGKRVFDALGKSARPMERKDDQSAFDMAAQTWISRYTAQKVQSISQTTRRQIIDAISEGESQGLGIDATARLVRVNAGGVIASTRAAIIARTESHAAATFGGDAAVEALGLPNVQREWMAASDARTRETHQAADGQRVGMDEPFQVGGSSLMRPGDPAGPPEESINCRCTIGYIAPGFE